MRPDIPLHEMAEVNPSRPKITLDLATEVSFVPMADVSESGRWEKRQARPLRDVSSGYTYFGEGDVLFAKITPCTENGKGFHAVGVQNGVGFASTEFHVLRARDNADAGFIYQWSIYKPLRLKAAAAMTGSAGQQRVPSSFLASFRVPLILKEEQTKIAEILSTVDQAIEQTEVLIAKQQRIKTGLMQDLLTRGIDEHGNLRSEQTHEFKDSPLGRIPVEWDCVQFGSCMATKPTNGIYKPQSAYAESGVPIVRIDGYKNGDRIEGQTFKCVVLSIPEMMRYGLKSGDLLVNRVNSIDYLGKSALVGDLPQATVFESNMMRLRVNKQQLLPDFAIRVLSSSVAFRHFQRLAKIAIAQTSINQQDVCSLWLKKPCVEEQTRIVQVASACDGCIGELSDRQRKLRHIKIALMQDLLTGKRRVTALLSETEARA